MRVIAGRYRGRRLKVPPGVRTRPTADRVREALFSILGDVEDVRVADLFAGSGALGIEALSRGAEHATFVERDHAAVGVLRFNLAALGIVEGVEVFEWDVLGWLEAVGGNLASARSPRRAMASCWLRRTWRSGARERCSARASTASES